MAYTSEIKLKELEPVNYFSIHDRSGLLESSEITSMIELPSLTHGLDDYSNNSRDPLQVKL